MTPDEMQAVVDAVDAVMGRRMEEVYGELELVKQQVGEALEQFRATAEVLHSNDLAVMAQLARVEGDGAREVVEIANDRWRRFVMGECERMGLKVVVPKGGAT